MLCGKWRIDSRYQKLPDIIIIIIIIIISSSSSSSSSILALKWIGPGNRLLEIT